MKHILHKKKTTATGIGCLVFLVMMIHLSCSKKIMTSWEDYVVKSDSTKFLAADTTKQIIVWRRPGSDPSYLNFWLDSIKNKYGNIEIPMVCQNCDNSLMLLTGTGIQNFIQGSGSAKGGGSKCVKDCPPAGGGDTLYWCVNFPVDINDSSYYNPNMDKLAIDGPAGYRDPEVTVAVFDTGVDPDDIRKYLYSSNTPCCLGPGARSNWNFCAGNNIITDDFNPPVLHGATVARFIIDQADFYKKNSVKILPLKIHNSAGESNLYYVLCGFAYAKDRGAQIINASFGYYALKNAAMADVMGEDPAALLLKKYIQYYLTDNNILLIAAAGNKNVKDNDAGEIALFTNAGLTPPADLHNLDNVNFYPASLAADPEMTNVIAVTTVHNGEITPLQNVSNTVVDIGVNADMASLSDAFFFKNPRLKNGWVQGSSFATPIVAGIICAHYKEITDQFTVTGQTFNKENILNFLLQMPVGQHDPRLDAFIRKGVMFTNAHAW